MVGSEDRLVSAFITQKFKFCLFCKNLILNKKYLFSFIGGYTVNVPQSQNLQMKNALALSAEKHRLLSLRESGRLHK